MATFTVGLKQDSRVKMLLSKQTITLDQILLARICDELAFISWSKTKDGQRNRNRPESVLNNLLNANKKTEKEINSYASGDDFKDAWDSIIGGHTDA